MTKVKITGVAAAALFLVGLFYRKPTRSEAAFQLPVSYTFH